MTSPSSGAKAPLDSAQDAAASDPAQRFITRMRWMMAISGATTVLAVAAILGVIGYRLLHQQGSASSQPTDMTALLPKGAKVVSTSVSGGRIAVILDVGGSVEVRTFDINTLRLTGTLKFATEP
jgi:preprotein translocase subunit YajC